MKAKIIEEKLSYSIVGILYDIHNSYGRYCTERQYADILVKKLNEKSINFKREFPIVVAEKKSSFADFIIEDKLLLELKAQPLLTRKDYYQVKKYLELLDFELGLLVNFRSKHLNPKRILNSRYSDYSGHSDKFVDWDYSKAVAALPTIIIVAMIILLASIGAASSGFVENLISYSELESKKALFAAEAGAKDAFKRIGRNKDCNVGGSATCASYSIAVGDATSTITVSGANNKTILSSGQVGNIEVKIQVETYFDANNKLIQSTWKQID